MILVVTVDLSFKTFLYIILTKLKCLLAKKKKSIFEELLSKLTLPKMSEELLMFLSLVLEYVILIICNFLGLW